MEGARENAERKSRDNTSHSKTPGPATKFLQCQRCGTFILSETSTVKRIHNVKCLNSAVVARRNSVINGPKNSEVFQGFVPREFLTVTTKLARLSTTEIARVREKLRNDNDSKRGKARRPRGKNRCGVEISNIIEESRGSRRSSLKAKAKFKELEDGSISEESDNELRACGVPGKMTGTKRRRDKDEDFIASDEIRGPNGAAFNSRQTKTVTEGKSYNKCSRAICIFCHQPVKAQFLEMHVSHFHTEGHDQQPCDCDVNLCGVITRKTRTSTISSEDKLLRAKELMKAKAQCQICGKFVLKCGMKKHHFAVHAKTTKTCIKNYECIVCHNYFAHVHGLKVHFVAIHLETTPFVCKFDGCKFRGGNYFKLERHVRKHIQGTKRKCLGCGKLVTCLLKHRNFCHNNVKTTPPRIESHRDGRIGTKGFSIEEPVKAEVGFEIDSINLYDKIIETEMGPIHVKGERLVAYPEVAQEVNTNNTNSTTANLKQETDGELPNDNGEDYDGVKIRETISDIIYSWNDKLRDNSYLTSVIKQDPLFQKLEKENVEFTKMILRGVDRRNYFIVNKSASKSKFAYRCDKCSSAFTRSWALEKHKKACPGQAGNNNAGVDDGVSGNECEEGDNSNNDPLALPATKSDSIANDKNSMSFMCSGCGFQSKSAKELEVHMKTSPVHNFRGLIGRNHQCPKKCGGWFGSVKELNDHLDEIHLKTPEVKCEHCPKLFSNKTLLGAHIYNVHTNYERFVCKLCGKKYRSKENCEKHETECVIEQRRPKCQKCGEHFCNVTGLRKHVHLVHLNKTISNTVNSNRFKTGIHDVTTNNPTTSNNAVPETQQQSDDESMILGV